MFLSSIVFSRVVGVGEEDLENNMDSTEYECQWRNNAQQKCQDFPCFQCLLNPLNVVLNIKPSMLVTFH